MCDITPTSTSTFTASTASTATPEVVVTAISSVPSVSSVQASSNKRKCDSYLSQGDHIFKEAVKDTKMLRILDELPSFSMTVKIPPSPSPSPPPKSVPPSTEKKQSSYTEFVVRIHDQINQVSYMKITSVGAPEDLTNGRYYQPATMMIHWSNRITTHKPESSLSSSSSSDSTLGDESAAQMVPDSKASVEAHFTILPPAIEFEELMMQMNSKNLLKTMIIPGFGDYVSSLENEVPTDAKYKSDNRLYNFDLHDFKIAAKIKKMCQNSISDFQHDNFYHWFQGIMAQPVDAYQENNMKLLWKVLLRYCSAQSEGSHPILNRPVQMNVLFFLCQQSHFSITTTNHGYLLNGTGGCFDIMKMIIGDSVWVGVNLSPLDLDLCRWYYENSKTKHNYHLSWFTLH